MPILRVACDKRGVETTALLHTSRGHAKGKPRLLYWFRTPPDIRVGREAIDETAIKQLEQAHPDVTFDWPQILHASRSLAAAGAKRARDERAGLVRSGGQSRRARQQLTQPALPAAPTPDQPEAAAEVPAKPQESVRRRRRRRGSSRQRQKGGGNPPPETNQ